MKNLLSFALISALSLSLIHAAPASAEWSAQKKYKVWHYAAYIPIQVVGFLIAGPVMLATSWAQHKEDQMKADLATPIPTGKLEEHPFSLESSK